MEDLDVRIAAVIDVPSRDEILALAVAQAVAAALDQPEVIDRLATVVAERLASKEG